MLKRLGELIRIFVLHIKNVIMGVNGTYPTENPLTGGDKILASSEETGKTTQITVDQLATYIQTEGTGKLAVYDGATDLATYDENFLVGDTEFIRLGFSGPKTNENWFPESYGRLMVNDEAAPAGSKFDFRFLPAGQYVEFEVDFGISILDTGNGVITPNVDYNFLIEAHWPNGTVDSQTFKVPTSSSITNGQVINNYRFRFTTLIDDVLTDSLLGGYIAIGGQDGATTDKVRMINLLVTARI